MKYIFTLTLILLAGVAQAASGGAGHGEIPTKLIGYQTFNVVVMFAALIYFLHGPIRSYFTDKRTAFLSAAQKAEAARKAAEDERMQIQVRLTKLESTADESIARARAEAADMKKQMIAEAEALSKRIRDEAQEAARLEVEKARIQIREALIKESLQSARAQLSEKVTSEDHQRLQANFINKIQAVQK